MTLVSGAGSGRGTKMELGSGAIIQAAHLQPPLARGENQSFILREEFLEGGSSPSVS